MAHFLVQGLLHCYAGIGYQTPFPSLWIGLHFPILFLVFWLDMSVLSFVS
jgi:hypothetical protein